jgi:osmotically-inducible protein OsmY
LQGNWIVLKKKVKVENGWVTIEGQMTWNYQKEALKRSINNIIGVKGVTFRINIKSECRDEIEKQTIKSAFARNWSINDLDIEIVILGDKVTLSGRVNSWDDREEAERLTWNAPGVCIVDNELVVNYDYLLGD